MGCRSKVSTKGIDQNLAADAFSIYDLNYV